MKKILFPTTVRDKKHILEPSYIGPGVWYIIHTYSLIMNDTDYIKFIDDLSKVFNCEKCRSHFQSYLSDNPIEDYVNYQFTDLPKNLKNEHLGKFYWSFMYHNNVNVRLGKQTFDFLSALKLYNVLKENSEDASSSECSSCSSKSDESEISVPSSSKSSSSSEESVFKTNKDKKLPIPYEG